VLSDAAMDASPLRQRLAGALALIKRQVMLLKAMSFAAVGVVNAAVDFAVFLLALQFLTSSLVAANVLAWLVAVSGSYVMNSFITFAAESGRKLAWRPYFTFVASGILGVIANTTTLVVTAMFMPVILAKLCAIGAGFVVNFSMSHFVVFRPRRTAGDAADLPPR
jgi:putative flippase GtrA